MQVQSKRVQKNIDGRTSPWIIAITEGNESNSNKNNKSMHAESSTLARPPMFLCAVPTVLRFSSFRGLRYGSEYEFEVLMQVYNTRVLYRIA